MAQSLLDLVNEVLRKAGFITGESGLLTSLTDAARQVEIDIAKRNWNTAISELYSLSKVPYPQEEKTATITLITGQREYTLPSDLVQIRFPLIFEADQHRVDEYPGGFERLRVDQLDPSNWTGRPTFAVISPINDKLRFDYEPTSAENGDQYTLYYDRELFLDVAADTVAFSDVVARHMVEVVLVDWKDDQRPTNRSEVIRSRRNKRKNQLSLAVKYLTRKQVNSTWGARRSARRDRR